MKGNSLQDAEALLQLHALRGVLVIRAETGRVRGERRFALRADQVRGVHAKLVHVQVVAQEHFAVFVFAVGVAVLLTSCIRQISCKRKRFRFRQKCNFFFVRNN